MTLDNCFIIEQNQSTYLKKKSDQKKAISCHSTRTRDKKNIGKIPSHRTNYGVHKPLLKNVRSRALASIVSNSNLLPTYFSSSA